LLPIDLVVAVRLRRPGGLRAEAIAGFVVVLQGYAAKWAVPLARAGMA